MTDKIYKIHMKEMQWTIIMVTHSQHDANYADRIVNLFDGEVVSQVEM